MEFLDPTTIAIVWVGLALVLLGSVAVAIWVYRRSK